MSLIETIAALAIESILLLGLVATLGTVTVMNGQLREQRDRSVDLRRIEHLLDHAVSEAESGSGGLGPIAAAEPTRLLLRADLNKDGTIDPRSSERTEFYLREDDGNRRLLQRLGRQSMTLVRELPAGAKLLYRDERGRSTTDPKAIRLLSLPVGDGEFLRALRKPAP